VQFSPQALKERNPGIRLQLAQGLAYGGLADIQQPRCLAGRARSHDGVENLNFAQKHISLVYTSKDSRASSVPRIF
jgi:hypothetical protein